MSLAGRTDLLATAVGQEIKQARIEQPRPKRFRQYRPILTGIGPGVDSKVLGRYWYDGVEMNWEVAIQMAATGSGFVANNPSIRMPTAMLMADPVAARAIGVGHIHDATTGLIYGAQAIRKDANNIGIYYGVGAVASQATPVATNGPQSSWKILDGMYLKGSYLPATSLVPRNFLAYGDSIVRFENTAGQVGDIGWAPQVATSSLLFGGGFARDGGTSAVVLANAVPLSADVGVCHVGVNDIAQGVAQATTLANVSALRTKVGSDKWLLCRIAPYDANPTVANALNVQYQNMATANGWAFVDPWADYRAANGTWVSGASYDGTHPNPPVTTAAALRIRAAIQAIQFDPM